MEANITRLATQDVMQDSVLVVRIKRSFHVRTKIALWLIKAAAAVLTIPAEIEIKRKGE